jgi:F0F1-type ATP synthase gamma subunit
MPKNGGTVRLACLSKFSVHDRDDTQSEAQEHTQDLKRIKKQKMKYNRSRQAMITKELIEIISGAEAL